MIWRFQFFYLCCACLYEFFAKADVWRIIYGFDYCATFVFDVPVMLEVVFLVVDPVVDADLAAVVVEVVDADLAAVVDADLAAVVVEVVDADLFVVAVNVVVFVA